MFKCSSENRAVAFAPAGPIPAPPSGWTWPGLMGEALLMAEEGRKKGEIPVGALVVEPSGRILSRSHNENITTCDPSAHAEILAMRRAGLATNNHRLGNSVLVVTLEPCLMCAGALVHARVAGLVFGAADALAGSIVSRADVLDFSWHNHRPWHMGGVRSEECADVLRNFFKDRRAIGLELKKSALSHG